MRTEYYSDKNVIWEKIIARFQGIWNIYEI